MPLICFSANKRAHSGAFAMHKIHKILLDAMQTRWKTFVLETIEVNVG